MNPDESSNRGICFTGILLSTWKYSSLWVWPTTHKHMNFASEGFSAWVTRTFHPVRGHWCSGHEIACGEAWVCVCVCVSGSKWATAEKQVGTKSLNFPSMRTTALTSLHLFVSEGPARVSLVCSRSFSSPFFCHRAQKKKKKRKKSAVPLHWSGSLLVALMSHCDSFFPPLTPISLRAFPLLLSPSLNGSARTLNIKKKTKGHQLQKPAVSSDALMVKQLRTLVKD